MWPLKSLHKVCPGHTAKAECVQIRNLHTEGTLLEQLKLKWVQATCTEVLKTGGALARQLKLWVDWGGEFSKALHAKVPL